MLQNHSQLHCAMGKKIRGDLCVPPQTRFGAEEKEIKGCLKLLGNNVLSKNLLDSCCLGQKTEVVN